MTEMLLSDPRVSSIKTVDCGERLVLLEDIHRRVLIDSSAKNLDNLGYPPIFLVRASVASKLVFAAESLPFGLAILVKEALRPLPYQEFIFNRRLHRLAAKNTGLSENQLVELTSKFIAPPWVAGHPTGGAVDVTLCSPDGQELDMGCAYDEDENASEGRCLSFATNINSRAKENRDILFTALNKQEFVNYPFEWWHWSFGDKYWAVILGASSAIYGIVDNELIVGTFSKLKNEDI